MIDSCSKLKIGAILWAKNNLKLKVALLAEIFKKSEAAIIFSTGYLANYSILSSIFSSNIFKKNPIVFSDKLNHQCIYEGCKNKKINFLRFHHNDINHLEYLLKKNKLKRNPKFILSESVFSMDGDFADIKALVYLKKKYNSFLFLDEALVVLLQTLL